MTATLTGLVIAQLPDDEAGALARIQASIDAVVAHSAYRREQFVLASAEDAEASRGDEVELAAVEVSSATLEVALAAGEPIDLHVLIDTPEDVLLPLLLEIDLSGDEPRVDIVTEDTALDARGLLLALVEIWGARVGYHTDDELMEASADYVVPIGQLTWLDDELSLSLSISSVPIAEAACGGWLFTLPHDIGDPAAVADVRAIVEAADE